MPASKTINLTISDELLAALDREAQRHGITRSRVARSALAAVLGDPRLAEVPRPGRPADSNHQERED